VVSLVPGRGCRFAHWSALVAGQRLSRGAQPYRRSARPGQPPGPADLMPDINRVKRAGQWPGGTTGASTPHL